MKINFKVGTIIYLFLVISISLQAQISLPSVFCDNMVLQQNTKVPIWGQGRAGENLKLVGSWLPNDTVVATVDSKGRWEADINTTMAGGPYTLKIIEPSAIELQNVMLGEVWLCSGQSNMEWKAKSGLVNKEEEIIKADHPNIRFFRTANRGADYPQYDCEGKWEICTPETMSETSAVAYFFARKLQEEMNVPVGLIVSAWGGTPAEVWAPKESVENNEILKKNAPTKQFAWWPIESGALYNQMIYPLISYRIAGALWYQGESNHEKYESYDLLIKTMVSEWRKNNGHDFPFYFVQIAPYKYNSKVNAPALFREQQEKTSRELLNSGMIVVSDLVHNVSDIHPIDKQNVGFRLANMALAETYKLPIKGYKSPVFKNMEVKKNKLILHFDNAEQGLKMQGDTINALVTTDNDGKIILAKTKIVGNTIVITSEKLPPSVKVRYCFDDDSTANLFGIEGGLPVAPFRTDKD